MYIQYLDSAKTKCQIDGYQQVQSGVAILGSSITKVEGYGFKIYDTVDGSDTLVFNGEKFKYVYDSGSNYIIYADGSVVYYDFLVLDQDNYVVSITMRKNLNTIPNGWLYQSGVSRQYAEFEFTYLSEEYGYPLYKIQNNTLTPLSAAEQTAHKNEAEARLLADTIAAKLEEINQACTDGIVGGVTVNNESFSYTLEDQRNLLAALQTALTTRMSVPYHSNGNSSRLFTLDEIVEIYGELGANLSHHITYANQLKLYTKSLSSISAVSAVTYGQALTGQYLTTYTELVEQARSASDAYIENAKQQFVWVKK